MSMQRVVLLALLAASPVAAIAIQGRDAGSGYPSLTDNHTALTSPFWQGYNYCQGVKSPEMELLALDWIVTN